MFTKTYLPTHEGNKKHRASSWNSLKENVLPKNGMTLKEEQIKARWVDNLLD